MPDERWMNYDWRWQWCNALDASGSSKTNKLINDLRQNDECLKDKELVEIKTSCSSWWCPSEDCWHTETEVPHGGPDNTTTDQNQDPLRTGLAMVNHSSLVLVLSFKLRLFLAAEVGGSGSQSVSASTVLCICTRLSGAQFWRWITDIVL